MAWLLGNYTVLLWPGLRLLLRRLGLTAGRTALALVLLSCLLNASDQVALLQRGNLTVLLLGLGLWSLVTPLILRRVGMALGTSSPLPLMASQA
jgi:hypothetical protein